MSEYEVHIAIDGNGLTLDDVASVARANTTVSLAPTALQAVESSRALVDRWVAEAASVYGVTTGFGELQDVSIPTDEVARLQLNIILSHAAGCGPEMPKNAVRAMMLLRANALAKGFSGVRPTVIDYLIRLLNADIVPVVPTKGSVGSSGDLAPLAHMTLVLLGRGQADTPSGRMDGAGALKTIDLAPLELGAKEGLALVNGTQFMTAYATLAATDARNLVKAADIIGAMSLEALKGKREPFRPIVALVRRYSGLAAVSSNVLRLVDGSTLVDTHDEDTARDRQDAYCLRCMPQVHGASREALDFIARSLHVEINSATDNPLIVPDEGEVCSAGNFHGQLVALPIDFLKIALAELASISERRTARLVDRKVNRGLPAFLVNAPGVNSGMMIGQYTAAALVSENKILSHPVR